MQHIVNVGIYIVRIRYGCRRGLSRAERHALWSAVVQLPLSRYHRWVEKYWCENRTRICTFVRGREDLKAAGRFEGVQVGEQGGEAEEAIGGGPGVADFGSRGARRGGGGCGGV